MRERLAPSGTLYPTVISSGTYTPTFTQTGQTFASVSGMYQRFGNILIVGAQFTTNNTVSGQIITMTLPEDIRTTPLAGANGPVCGAMYIGSSGLLLNAMIQTASNLNTVATLVGVNVTATVNYRVHLSMMIRA